jgi:hypothetical protein
MTKIWFTFVNYKMDKMDRQDCLIMIQIKLKVKNIQLDLSLNLIMLIPLIRYHEENFKM